jgi:hypothetical protein
MQDKEIAELLKLYRAFAVTLIFIFVISYGMPVFAADEIHFSNELSVSSNNRSGAGENASSLPEGVYTLNVLGINGSGEINQYTYSYNLGIKATDDRTNDPKSFSLTNLQGKFSNRVHTLTLGDTFEFFSQYSLSTALKGASYRFFDEAKRTPEMTLIYGVAYPRWDNIWHEPKTRSLERQVYGGRFKYEFASAFTAGVSVVASDDSKRINSSDALIKNIMYELDAEYKPIPGLTLNAEAALNETDESPGAGAAGSTYNGNAVKFEAVGDGGPSRVSLEFERVSPDFMTVTGAATPDREKFKAKWKYKFNRDIAITSGLLWYRDNLEDNKAYTTNSYKPEIAVAVKKLFGRQYSAAEITYKFDSRDGGGTSTSDHITNFNYRDRFGVFDSDTNLGCIFYDEEKQIRDGQEYTYNTSLTSRHTAGRFILKPSVYAGGWTLNDELSNSTDMIYEYSLGLGADIPDLRITSNIKFGQNKLQKDIGDDLGKLFGNLSIYIRPAFLSGLNQGMIFLRAFVNDFDYTTRSRNFRESSITAGLNIQI